MPKDQWRRANLRARYGPAPVEKSEEVKGRLEEVADAFLRKAEEAKSPRGKQRKKKRR